MLVSKIACPSCRTVLKTAQPLTAGKRVTCPKCGTPFAVAAPPQPPQGADPDTLVRLQGGVDTHTGFPAADDPFGQVTPSLSRRRKQGGSKVGLIVGSLCVLCVGGGIALYALSGGKKEEDSG